MKPPFRHIIPVLIAALTLLSPHRMAAQQHATWEEYLHELMDDGEPFDEASLENMYDILSGFADHPLNINTATREDLEQFPFLTSRQIEDLCEYLYRHGSMKTIDELILIESLDRTRAELLKHLVYAGDGEKKPKPTLAEMIRHGRNTITATAKIPLYEREGDRKGYLGYKYKHWLRYDFGYGDRMRFGLIASQDAGEPLFAENNAAGYDYYSFYLQLRDMGRIESLTLGRYRASFGMGLVAGTSFNLGKTAMLTSLGRSPDAIRVHSSRSEADYFQGAAVTVGVTKQLKASVFASYRPLDATLNEDGTAATIIKTGYHRTITEIEKKNNTHATTAGANIHYATGGFHAGATAIYTHLDRRLNPKTGTLYRYNYAKGSDFLNMSINYGYRNYLFTLRGETATDRRGAIATINTAGLTPNDRLNIVLLQRFYSFRYTSLHAGSFSDGGHIQNENGLYLGLTWRQSPYLQLSAYTDFAYFAWPKYLISRSSYSSDNMFTATYSRRSWTLSGRYRLRVRQRDNTDKKALINRTEHRMRLSATKNAGQNWNFKTQMDCAMTHFKQRDFGWMATQNINYTNRRIKLNMSAAYFHTDSYDSRVYAYEHSMLYTFSIPAFYGHGIRYTLLARADIGRIMTLTAKAGVTDYFDRSTISSGKQAISRSSMTDIEMQARIKL